MHYFHEKNIMTETEPQMCMEMLWYSDCIRGAISFAQTNLARISNCVGLSRHGNSQCESLTEVLMRLFVINTLPKLTCSMFKSNLPCVASTVSFFFLLKTPKDFQHCTNRH